MDKNELIGHWNIAKGKIKEEWSGITNDELLKTEGQRDQLIGHIQKKYGVSKERAERQFSKFIR